MKLKETASEIEKILTNTSPDKLTDFNELTSSQVYLCICAILEIFINFLNSLSSRFAPVVEILSTAYEELTLLKKAPEEFSKEDNPEEETETVHYSGHYIKAHDITRSCHNHPDEEKEELRRVKEENRALRVEIDKSENLQKQKEDEYKVSLEKLKNKNRKLEEKIIEMDLQQSSQTSNWPSSMERYPGGDTYRNGRYKEYDRRMEEEEAGETSDKEEINQESRRGGRIGHKGYSGNLLEKVVPDEVIPLYPKEIPQEDRDKFQWQIAGIHHTLGISLRTVVTEFVQMETKIKGDRSPAITVKGVFPPQAKSELTYDSSFVWLVETYYTIGLMGMGRIAQIIRTQLGVTMSKSTVNNIIKKGSVNLRAASACITEVMKTEGENPECVYTADETDLTVGSKKYYDHVLVGDKYALHTISHTRGLEGAYKSGVLENYQGWLVTDFFGMYKKRDWKSAFDRAHLTRELKAAEKMNPDCDWIRQMQEFFYHSYKAYHKARAANEPVPKEELIRLEEEYDKAVEKGLEEENKMFSKTRNLLHRFIDYKDGIIANLYNTDIFLTSNAAERQCKKIKRRLDVSGHFDTLKGAEDYAATLSVIETGVLQGLDSIEVIQQVLGGNITYPITGIKDDSISMITDPIMTTERNN